MTIKSSVSLTDEQYAFAKALVEAGRFSSVSAVLQQGVDLLRQRMQSEELETEALKVLLERRRNGSFLGATEMDARIEALIADKRRGLALRE
ncbi:MAG: type II toxin-antitoxin system ParD family antitoxin [Gammaproteobacteria bacterium]|nr:MAG: type II toxin-antitoxin system ParD family antitoxin [Gammaproteobacteria bacterium]